MRREGCLDSPSTRLIVILEGAQRLKDLSVGYGSSHDKLPTLVEQLTVHECLPTFAHVADEVPMHGAGILTPDLGETAADRHVDAATDLLIEQDIAGEALDAVVCAEGELAQIAGAFIGIQDRV